MRLPRFTPLLLDVDEGEAGKDELDEDDAHRPNVPEYITNIRKEYSAQDTRRYHTNTVYKVQFLPWVVLIANYVEKLNSENVANGGKHGHHAE